MNLDVVDVGFSYANAPVLQDLSFGVPAGDFLTILGPNGSGKSTLLKLIDRILLPTKGRILLDGVSLQQYSRKELAQIIGYVPQETNWIFPFTVLEAVLMGRAPSLGSLGFERKEDVEIARRAMDVMDIGPLRHKPVTALSGGERQRVLLARALAQEPRILLLDEPNAHLDLSHQLEMFRVVQRLNRDERLTVVSVSHDLNLAASFSKRILLLSSASGESGYSVRAIGSPGEVLTKESIADVFHAQVTVDRTSPTRLRITPDL